jgi:diaminopimelate decarboxylase
MIPEIPTITISDIVQKSIQQDLLTVEDTSAIFYDIDFLESRIAEVKDAFPKNSIHALALKANSLASILRILKKTGVGAEAASLPELQLALDLDFPNEKIIFDSPVKTRQELAIALKANVYINVDSFQELERIVSLKQHIESKSIIGLRINPQVGVGTIQSTSVAGKVSKFGIPLAGNIQNITEAFLKYDWLRGLHVHVGSQGMSPDLIVEGIQRIYDLAETINEKLGESNASHRIYYIDLGGGFPVKYNKTDVAYSFQDFAKQLYKTTPKLFTDKYRIITEYGRFIHANAAWAISKIEYVKNVADTNIIMSHLGADFLLRKAYNPKDWYHEISVLDASGNIKNNRELVKYSVAGPLCFEGDFIVKNIFLPKVEEGDYLIIHDVGAYTLSMWSKFNSRRVPKVLGYKEDNIQILKASETIDKTLQFWS